MKNSKVVTFLAVLIVSIVAVTVVWVLFSQCHYRDVLLVDQAVFGMTQTELEKVFGEADHIEKSEADDGAKTFCDYQIPLYSKLSEVTFVYVSTALGNRLCDVYISIPVENEADAEQIFEHMTGRLTTAALSEDGQIVKQTGTSFKFQISDGAEGVNYDIRIEKNRVTAACNASF